MNSNESKFRYTEWNRPDEMHFTCIHWISEMNFAKDEHTFFEDMLKEYTLPVLESHSLDRARELVTKLSASEKQEKELSKKLIAHRNNIKIVVEKESSQEEEKKYSEEHNNIKHEMQSFKKNFSALKKEIFETVTSALKKQKQKRLLN